MIALAFLSRMANAATPRFWVVLAVLGVALSVLAYCTTLARQDERQKAEQARVAAYTRQLEREAAADEKAAVSRLNDFQITTTREKERTDATAQLPDTRPSDRRVRRACVQLRQQGTRDLPPACL